jgi:hypothetical protein
MAQQPIPKKAATEIKPVITSIVSKLIGMKNASPKAAPKAAPKAVEKKVAPKVEPKKVMPKEAPKTVVVVPPAKEVEVVEAEDNTGFNDPAYIERAYKPSIQESSSSNTENVFLRSGLYKKNPQSGDISPTDKYRELNKSGRLKSYVKEFERREGIDKKFINEQVGKKVYFNYKKRAPVALESMKSFK